MKSLILLLLAVCTVHAEIDYQELYDGIYYGSMTSNEDYFGSPAALPAQPGVISSQSNPLEDITLEDETGIAGKLSGLNSARSGLDYIVNNGVGNKIDSILTPLQTLPTSFGSVTGWTVGQMDLGTTSFTLAMDLGPTGGLSDGIALFRLACLIGLSIAWIFLIAHTIGSYL